MAVQQGFDARQCMPAAAARRYINDQDLIGRRPVIASSRQQQQQLRFSSHGDRISRAAAMTAGEFSPSG